MLLDNSMRLIDQCLALSAETCGLRGQLRLVKMRSIVVNDTRKDGRLGGLR